MDHHAYYVEGPVSLFGAYKDRLRPYYARQYWRFGIDEARELQAIALLKNYADGVFLLSTESFTSEAQQALLKLFEEPQPGTRFVLVVPHGTLLPTLRSRMLEYPDRLEKRADVGDAKRFLSLSGKDRSDFIARLLKDEDGQKERVRGFLGALEAELSKTIGDAKTRRALQDIAMVRDYARDRSPSLKMLLEHLALALQIF